MSQAWATRSIKLIGLFTKLPYDVLRDLAPIKRLVSVPYVLAVTTGVGSATDPASAAG